MAYKCIMCKGTGKVENPIAITDYDGQVKIIDKEIIECPDCNGFEVSVLHPELSNNLAERMVWLNVIETSRIQTLLQ